MVEQELPRVQLYGEGVQNQDGTFTTTIRVICAATQDPPATPADPIPKMSMTAPVALQVVAAAQRENNPLSIDDSRKLWLLAVGEKSASKKVQVRICTIRDKCRKKGLMGNLG